MKITDIADAVAPGAAHRIIGVRPGEKIHEQMIGSEDAMHTFEYSKYYKVLPMIHQWSSDPSRIKNGRKVNPGFQYTSDSNTDWMTKDQLRNWIGQNLHLFDPH